MRKNPFKTFLQTVCFGVLMLTAACSAVPNSPTPTPPLMDPGPDECQDRVLVVVWGDRNGDGVQDPDEPLLQDVLLQIKQIGSAADEGLQMSTSENGRVSFPTRELEGCSPEGYQVLFLRQVAGYEFPEDPVVDLEGFSPDTDAVEFGLVPSE